MGLWNHYLVRRDVKRTMRRLDRMFSMIEAERDDPRVLTRRVRAGVPVRLRLRARVKLHRLWLRLRYGQGLLDMVDDCGREVERAVLFGEEHRG